MTAAYALTIFLGAFLLFQVQPLIGKYILPWFGGGPGVWTTCMLFFQVLLLGGYAYAHFITRKLRPKAQAILHLVLLVASLALLPIVPADSWKPRGTENPTLYILLLLTVCLGLPYFVLSTTGPLIQHWFLRSNPGRSPYRLYALSNVGSLLALISYPFYFETHFTRKTQATMWGFGLAAYALACAVCIKRLWNPVSSVPHPASSIQHPDHNSRREHPSWGTKLVADLEVNRAPGIQTRFPPTINLPLSTTSSGSSCPRAPRFSYWRRQIKSARTLPSFRSSGSCLSRSIS